MARGPKKQQRGKGGGRGEDESGGKRHARRFAKGALEIQDADGLDSDSEDHGDAFKQKKDKVNLNISDDDEEDGVDDEEGILNLEGSEEDSEDEEVDEDEEELDEEEWMERAIAKGGRTGAMAAQAKALGQKLKLQQGEVDSSEEEEEEERQGKGRKKGATVQELQEQEDRDWGANKRAYYADGESGEASDEEAAAEEEAEVLRLQQQRAKRTTAADYGVDDEGEEEEVASSSSEEEDEAEQEADTLEQAAKQAAAGRAARKAAAAKAPQRPQGAEGAPGVHVERVERDLAALSEADRAAALEADAPELLALLGDMEAGLLEIRHKLGPLLDEIKSGRLATKEGLSYLEVKHLMMLHYCAHIVFYILLKAEGRPVRDHPVMQRLVEIRTCLEKIRPIDKQMAYQVDKLVRATQAAQQTGAAPRGAMLQGEVDGGLAGPKHGGRGGGADEDEEDMLAFRPNPSQLMAKAGGQAPVRRASSTAAGGAEEEEEEEDGGSGLGVGKIGIYRPPKLNPVSMDGDGKRSKGLSRDERRRLAEAGRRAARSEVVRSLAAEVAGAPEEERYALPGLDSSSAIKMRQRLEMRAAEEEDMMTRVPLSREQAKALKAQRRAGMSTSGFADDFADDVADLVEAAGGADGSGGPGARSGLSDLFSRQKVSQRFGGEAPRPVLHGGDEDLPRRAPLHERRAQFDAKVARKAARNADAFDDDEDMYDLGGGGGGKRKSSWEAGEEDEFYTAAKEGAVSRKKARKEKYSAPSMAPALPDEEVGEGQPRKITQEIQKNRGLTPHRRKDLKNPRKKHRIKYADAMVRRKGAVQDVATGAAGAYGGEATGIKSRVTKGRKLG